MLGGVLHVTEPTLDAAIATTEEAVRVARAAGVDGALAIALKNLATWLPLEESQRAFALVDEAIEIGTRIGDRQSVSNAMAARAKIAARRGDWRTALRGAVDAAEQALELGDLGLVSRSLYTAGVRVVLARVLRARRRPLRQGHRDSGTMGRETTLEMLAATDAALLETLGEQQVATLAKRGAALDNTDAVAYLHAEADRALAAP